MMEKMYSIIKTEERDIFLIIRLSLFSGENEYARCCDPIIHVLLFKKRICGWQEKHLSIYLSTQLRFFENWGYDAFHMYLDDLLPYQI